MARNMSEKFFSKLRWIVERKDFEDFWPVGCESTGTRYWAQLVLDIDANKRLGKTIIPDYPTSNMVLVFCLIYGMRELMWSPNECAEFIEYLFETAQSIKHGDIFNTNGMNLIWDNNFAIKMFDEGVNLLAQDIPAQDIHELSGLVLALAESEYFLNHRIGTEKHGPYLMPDGSILTVRSFKNLHPVELWPQLDSISLTNDEFHLIFQYRIQNISFDVLSNQISSSQFKDSLLAVSIVGEAEPEREWNITRIEEFATAVRRGIRIIGEALSKMDQRQKSERLTEILYFGCRNGLDEWKEKAYNAIIVGRRHSIQYFVPRFGNERIKYYDLTQPFILSNKS